MWLCLLQKHDNITGVPEQALGWLPLGLGWLWKMNLLSFHVHQSLCLLLTMLRDILVCALWHRS